MKILSRITAIALLIPVTAQAQYFTSMPYSFVDGSTAEATQVNANFIQLIGQGNASISSITTAISGISTTGVPVAATMYVNAASCPSGWVIANGGAGIPDLRGVYVRGLDSGTGRDPGRTLGSFQTDSFLQHSHSTLSGSNGITSLPLSGAAGVGSIIPIQAGSFSSIFGTNTQTFGGSTETRPNSLVYTPCYKKAVTGGANGITYFSQPPFNLTAYKTVPPAGVVNSNFSRIVSDGNKAFTNLQTQITSFSGSGSVPYGAVVGFWSVACPTGWYAADGNNGTPDMRGRFATFSHNGAVGSTFGDNMASHQHFVGPMPTFGTSVSTSSILFQGSGSSRSYANSSTSGSGSVGNAFTGRFDVETRPKNIALLYCMKHN